MNTRHYFSKMNNKQQAAYYAIEKGLRELAPEFAVPMLEGSGAVSLSGGAAGGVSASDGRSIFDIHFLLRLDNPDIFYASGLKYKYYDNSSEVSATVDYLFDKKKIKSHQQAMESRVEKLVRPAMNLSDEEKLKYIHDFICQNVTYDKLKKQYSHEIIGPLGQGVGVCEGISKTVKILCDKLGIWCTIAISEANPEKGIKYRHAWNVVKIGGKYYHMDATFDNSLGKMHKGEGLDVGGSGGGADGGTKAGKKGSDDNGIRYDYFMLSDKQIFKDHEPVIWSVPKCDDDDSFYYKKQKLSFTKIEDVAKRAAQAVKKGKILTFHWRGGGLSKDVLRELLDVIEEAAETKGKHAKVYANIPQAVIRVTFGDGLAQFVEEDADEGNR